MAKSERRKIEKRLRNILFEISKTPKDNPKRFELLKKKGQKLVYKLKYEILGTDKK